MGAEQIRTLQSMWHVQVFKLSKDVVLFLTASTIADPRCTCWTNRANSASRKLGSNWVPFSKVRGEGGGTTKDNCLFPCLAYERCNELCVALKIEYIGQEKY